MEKIKMPIIYSSEAIVARSSHPMARTTAAATRHVRFELGAIDEDEKDKGDNISFINLFYTARAGGDNDNDERNMRDVARQLKETCKEAGIDVIEEHDDPQETEHFHQTNTAKNPKTPKDKVDVGVGLTGTFRYSVEGPHLHIVFPKNELAQVLRTFIEINSKQKDLKLMEPGDLRAVSKLVQHHSKQQEKGVRHKPSSS